MCAENVDWSEMTCSPALLQGNPAAGLPNGALVWDTPFTTGNGRPPASGSISGPKMSASVLSLLVVIALLNAPIAMIQTGAFAVLSSNPADAVVHQLVLAEAVLLLIPAVVCVVAVVAGAWLRRRAICAVLARGAALVGRCARRACNCAGAQPSTAVPLLDPIDGTDGGDCVSRSLI